MLLFSFLFLDVVKHTVCIYKYVEYVYLQIVLCVTLSCSSSTATTLAPPSEYSNVNKSVFLKLG